MRFWGRGVVAAAAWITWQQEHYPGVAIGIQDDPKNNYLGASKGFRNK